MRCKWYKEIKITRSTALPLPTGGEWRYNNSTDQNGSKWQNAYNNKVRMEPNSNNSDYNAYNTRKL